MTVSPERIHPALVAGLVGLVALALALSHLGDADFVGDDEALDAGVVWQMAERGEWMFPRFNADYLPPKPPLVSWLGAATALADGGFSEWSVRLPSALAGAALVTMTVAAGATLVGRGPALVGGLMLAVMPVVHSEARVGRADMTMAALVAACVLLFHRSPSPLPKGRRWLFHGLLGLALIAKGAVGVGLVAVVVLLDAVMAGRLAALRSLVDPAALAFLVVGGSWYVAGTIHWGEEFVARHIIGENLRHFFGGLVTGKTATRGMAHRASHLLNIFLVTAPWGFVLPWAARDAWREGDAERSPHLRFLLGWALGGLLFFTIATRKSPYYLLPLAPPVALLAGWWLWPRLRTALAGGLPAPPRATDLAAAGGFAALATLIAALGARGATSEGAAGAVLFAVRAHPAAFALILSVVLAGIAGLMRTLRHPAPLADRLAAATVPLWAAIAAILLLGNVIDGALAGRSSLRGFAAEVARRVPATDRVYFFALPLPAIVLYSGRQIPTLREGAVPAEQIFYLIVPETLEKDLPSEWRDRSVTLVRQTARVFTRRRMAIELREVRLGEGEEREGLTEDRSPPPARGRALGLKSGRGAIAVGGCRSLAGGGNDLLGGASPLVQEPQGEGGNRQDGKNCGPALGWADDQSGNRRGGTAPDDECWNGGCRNHFHLPPWGLASRLPTTTKITHSVVNAN